MSDDSEGEDKVQISDEPMVDNIPKDEDEDINLDKLIIDENDDTSQPLTVDNIEDDEKNATFTFYNEDHTLGNILRNVMIKNKNVEFWGYTIPHPSEPYMKLRVQSQKDAKIVLKQGLKRIEKECDIISNKFTRALEEFDQSIMQ